MIFAVRSSRGAAKVSRSEGGGRTLIAGVSVERAGVGCLVDGPRMAGMGEDADTRRLS